MIHTNRCRHCGKMKHEHIIFKMVGPAKSQNAIRTAGTGCVFYDSGLAALDAHKEELYEASKQLAHLHSCEEEGLLSGRPTPQMWREATSKLYEILNQIEKEK